MSAQGGPPERPTAEDGDRGLTWIEDAIEEGVLEEIKDLPPCDEIWDFTGADADSVIHAVSRTPALAVGHPKPGGYTDTANSRSRNTATHEQLRLDAFAENGGRLAR
jgi:hypothetical protein